MQEVDRYSARQFSILFLSWDIRAEDLIGCPCHQHRIRHINLPRLVWLLIRLLRTDIIFNCLRLMVGIVCSKKTHEAKVHSYQQDIIQAGGGVIIVWCLFIRHELSLLVHWNDQQPLHYLNYLHCSKSCPHPYYHIHKISTMVCSSLLPVIFLGNLNHTLYLVHKCRLF